MKNLIVLSVVFTLMFADLKAQDPVFVNYNQSLLNLNPAFAGSNGGFRFQGSLLAAHPQSPRRNSIIASSVDQRIGGTHSSIAASFLEDTYRDGVLRTRSYSVIYAYEFSCPEGQLRVVPALQISYVNSALDISSLSFVDAEDPRLRMSPAQLVQWPGTIPLARKSMWDLSGGLVVHLDKISAGFSLYHINQPDAGMLGVHRLPMRTNGHASYTHKIDEKNLLQFAYVYQRQNPDQVHIFNVNSVIKNHLIAGVGFTSKLSGIASVGYRHPLVTVQYTYGSSPIDQFSSHRNSWMIQASFNLRGRDNRTSLTAFEKM